MERIGELTVYDRTSYDVSGANIIIERVGAAEIVFTNKTPLTRDMLNKMPNLKFIGLLATGYNVVDVVAVAKDKGIVVTNIPTYGTTAVSQMIFILLLEMCHHVWPHSEEVRKGAWSNSKDWCFWNYPLIELAGKSIGIVGFGKIGKALGEIAHAFGMKVLANDNYQNKELESDTLKQLGKN